jgi:hypothetical protein
MIWGIHGEFGSGKTLSMVKYGREFLGNSDYEVVCNTPFKADRTIVTGLFKRKKIPIDVTYIEDKEEYFREMEKRTHTLFLLDEGMVWLNNYNWKTIPEFVYERLTQIRKGDLHLIYTVPYIEFVAKKLRMMTKACIECVPFPPIRSMSLKQPGRPWIIRQDWRKPMYFDSAVPSEQLEKKYFIGRRWILRIGSTLKAFDTKHLVKNSIPQVDLQGLPNLINDQSHIESGSTADTT